MYIKFCPVLMKSYTNGMKMFTIGVKKQSLKMNYYSMRLFINIFDTIFIFEHSSGIICMIPLLQGYGVFILPRYIKRGLIKEV